MRTSSGGTEEQPVVPITLSIGGALDLRSHPGRPRMLRVRRRSWPHSEMTSWWRHARSCVDAVRVAYEEGWILYSSFYCFYSAVHLHSSLERSLRLAFPRRAGKVTRYTLAPSSRRGVVYFCFWSLLIFIRWREIFDVVRLRQPNHNQNTLFFLQLFHYHVFDEWLLFFNNIEINAYLKNEKRVHKI